MVELFKNDEVLLDQLAKSKAEFREELGGLQERIDPENFLSEIGEFDNEGNFIIKDEIKGKDENGDFIKVGGKKYYSAEARSRSNRGECLGYDIRKDNGVTRFFIGTMDGMLEKKGREYGSNGTFFDGTWLGNGEMDGYRVYSDGSSFRGKLDCLKPVSGTYRKVVNGEYQYTYEGDFKDGKYGGQGIIEYKNGDKYEGERKNGKKDGHGIYHYRDGHTYEGEWVDGEKKEGKGILTRASGERYEGDFLYDNDGSLKPFCLKVKKNGNIDRFVYQNWMEMKNGLGETESQSHISMKGIHIHPDGSRHEYSLTNGRLTEKSNDFIAMYGDKKPNEDRSKERGNITYSIDYLTDGSIEYYLSSWKKEITWNLVGGVYQFKNKKGTILKIKKTSSFNDKSAMHAANLINKIRYTNENAHGNRAYRYDNDDLYATTTKTHGYSSGRGITYHEVSYEGNGTTLLNNVRKHFGGVNPKMLAERLNDK